STPSSTRSSASSVTAAVVAATSHTRLTRRPAFPGSRTHTFPDALATSTAATRSITSSCSASGISSGSCFNSLVLQSHPPIPWRVVWGPRSRETEILIGVLAATVRDPSRSGPGARLTHGLTAQEHVGVGRRPEPIFHAPRGVPRRDWGLIGKSDGERAGRRYPAEASDVVLAVCLGSGRGVGDDHFAVADGDVLAGE